jgi:hypothetical protein
MTCTLAFTTLVPVGLPVFRQSIGPHELATAPTKFRHLLCTHLNLQTKLEQLKLNKTYLLTWS